MMFVGLDGCPDGWVAVSIDGDRCNLHFLSHISKLSELKFHRAAIDIPIGLPERGYRCCDEEARIQLGAHRSKVFLGARRSILGFADFSQANTKLHARGEPGLSLQLWHLREKLKQVDRFVRANASLDIREAHPEITFVRLNEGRPLLHNKSRKSGSKERLAILQRHGFMEMSSLLDRKRELRAKTNDILDACACAIAASDFGQGYALPRGAPPRDAKGLKMQIWY